MVALYGQLFQRRYKGQLDEEADRSLGFIIGGAQRMEMLLRDLLTYSQTGSDEEPAGSVDCLNALSKVTFNLQAGIEQASAMVSWNHLPEVKAHEIRIVQLFQNLVGNAIKYRGAESPVICVTAERQDNNTWLFCVEDNGIGIEPEYAQQVFGIFKRLHGHRYPGTGIGLAICQRIVERYGGRIWVEPAPAGGSRFYFTLPHVTSEGIGAVTANNPALTCKDSQLKAAAV